MVEKAKLNEHQYSTAELLQKAVQGQLGSDIYSNFAQITTTPNELILDFFSLTPIPGKQDTPKMVHVQRVILPLQITPGLTNALQSTWQGYQEKDMPIKVAKAQTPEG